jgi:Tol biopolymer transport system component
MMLRFISSLSGRITLLGRMLIAGLLMVSMLMVGSGGNSRSGIASATAPGLRGHIIFARAGDPYADDTIFVANADGSHQRQLGPYCCARISRDGKWILFAAGGPNDRVTTGFIRPDGTGNRVLSLPDKTINLGPGAWSPDGTHIAFQAWDDHHHARDGIYIGRSSDGGDLRRVTTATAGAKVPGDFSPDGKRLVFFQERPTLQGVGSVWVVNVDGTGRKRLTPPTFPAGFGTIRWSPDGQKILLQTGRLQPEGALWTVHPDGSHLTQLFKDRKGRFAISPTWSPDGTRIMFALDPINDEYSHPPNGLYVIKADGTGLTLIIGGDDFKREPDWVR